MLREQRNTVYGDVLLVSAFVSYVGYFTKKYRVQLLDQHWIPFLSRLEVSGRGSHPHARWHRGAPSPLQAPNSPFSQVPIPITPGLDPLSLLTDSADVATWSNQGLPSNRTYTENATILCNTERWPLIVDAQLQGIKWIKNKYGEELQAIRLGQKKWVGCCRMATGSRGDAGYCGHPQPGQTRAPEGSSAHGALTPLQGQGWGSPRGSHRAQSLQGTPPSSPHAVHPHIPPIPLQLPGHHRAGSFRGTDTADRRHG